MLGAEYTMRDARCASCEVRSARCRGLIPLYGTITVLRPDPDPERSWVCEGPPPRGLFQGWQSFYYVCMEGVRPKPSGHGQGMSVDHASWIGMGPWVPVTVTVENKE